jgi:hypothetical protein
MILQISFRMKHDYRNIVSGTSTAAATPTSEKLPTGFSSNDNIVWLEHELRLNLGRVSDD